MLKKILSVTVTLCFFLTSLGPLPKAHADSLLGLPAPGTMVNLSPAYEPIMIKGLTVHKDNPFLFDFIVDTGNTGLSKDDLKTAGDRLIRYFLACLTIPEKDLWVNLSPYEKDRMIPQALGQTALGRDLLAQDYILKQLTASLIYPEKNLGRDFWNRVYTKAREMYGTSQVPVNTFNKVWIMADKATVYEHNQTVFVLGGHLKVMLEEDYLALQKHSSGVIASEAKQSHTIASQIVKQIILPELEKEVNTGKNFATLRQIFNSLILASWYKKNLKEALLNQVYADKSTIKGNIANGAKQTRDQIYEQYIKAYKKGVFNYIKEDIQANGQTIPRKYFSGGFVVARALAETGPVVVRGETSTQQAMITEIFKRLGLVFLFSTLLVSSNPLMAQVLPNHGTKGKMPQAVSAQTSPILSKEVLSSKIKSLYPAFRADESKIGVEAKGRIALYTQKGYNGDYIFIDNVTGIYTPDEGKSLIVTVLEEKDGKKTEVEHTFIYSAPVPDDLLTIKGLGFDLSYKSDDIRRDMERYGYFVPTTSDAYRSRPELWGNFKNLDALIRSKTSIRLYTTRMPIFEEYERRLKAQTVAAFFHEVVSKAMVADTARVKEVPKGFETMSLNLDPSKRQRIGWLGGDLMIEEIPLDLSDASTREQLQALINWADLDVQFTEARLIYTVNGRHTPDMIIGFFNGGDRPVSAIGLNSDDDLFLRYQPEVHSLDKIPDHLGNFVELAGVVHDLSPAHDRITIEADAAMNVEFDFHRTRMHRELERRGPYLYLKRAQPALSQRMARRKIAPPKRKSPEVDKPGSFIEYVEGYLASKKGSMTRNVTEDLLRGFGLVSVSPDQVPLDSDILTSLTFSGTMSLKQARALLSISNERAGLFLMEGKGYYFIQLPDAAMSVEQDSHRSRLLLEMRRGGEYYFQKGQVPRSLRMFLEFERMGQFYAPQRKKLNSLRDVYKMALSKKESKDAGEPRIFIRHIEDYLASKKEFMTKSEIEEFLEELGLSPVFPDQIHSGLRIFTSLTHFGTMSFKKASTLISISNGRAGLFHLEGQQGYYFIKLPEAAIEVEPGGIDLNTSNGTQWTDNKDGKGVEMNVDPAMIARIRRNGIDDLSPEIFKITPLVNIWPLAGLQAPTG